MNSSNMRYRLALAAALSLGAMPQAFALTAAGQTVSNTASVAYKVGTVDQTPVSSLASTFLVDRVVDVSVVRDQVSLNVAPNATGQVLSFTVTNLSNSAQDFKLGLVEPTGDDFNVTSYAVYVDNVSGLPGSGTIGVYDPGIDTATYVDELAGSGTTRKVFVVATIPASATNNQFASMELTATAAQALNGDGTYLATPGTEATNPSAETNTGVADNAAYVDTVFGDGAGVTDAAGDGKFSAESRYIIQTATLAVIKTSRVVSDPFNGTTNPKAIPGAEIEYCLAVENSGSVAAGNIVLTDNLPVTYVAFVASSIEVSSNATTSDCATGTWAAGGSYSAPTVTVTAASIPASGRYSARFRVTVQ